MDKKRNSTQTFWAIITNSNFKGFREGKIYRGKTKYVCVPGMNCYSCPGARASCPIGSLQAVIGGGKYNIGFYIAGFLTLIGSLTGRMTCGYLCPFGFIQELLNKIPSPKKIGSFKGDKYLRKLKYVFWFLFAIILPVALADSNGIGSPYFCKLVCPVGTLEAGVPLTIANVDIRDSVGFLYRYKLIITMAILLLSIFIYRPFCKYICPLGAIYSLFNPIAVFRYHTDKEKCIHCGKCKAVCKMQCDPENKPNSPECVHCEECVRVCPVRAIQKMNKGSEKNGLQTKRETN